MNKTAGLARAFAEMAAVIGYLPQGLHQGKGSGRPDEPKAAKLRARRKANKVASASRKRNRRTK